MIEIHTDGACLGNPGPGGWAAIVVESGTERALHGGDKHTTNNRMEQLAAIKGLQSVAESSEVTVFSDSQYVVNTMTKNWKRKANLDLWDKLDSEAGKRKVSWRWVKAHAGNPLNEKADALAYQEARLAGANPSKAALTHVNESGKARMVDVGSKPVTQRVAVARGSVLMRPETLALVRANGFDKGDVLGVARVAGIMAAKNTSQLIPLCHPIPLNHVSIEFHFDDSRNTVDIEATASTMAKTGVEMEALTAVSVAALTIYDMCKSADRKIKIDDVRLVRKLGGKSGDIFLDDEGDGTEPSE